MVAIKTILVAMSVFMAPVYSHHLRGGPVVNDVIVGVDNETGRVYTDTESHRTWNNGVNDEWRKRVRPNNH